MCVARPVEEALVWVIAGVLLGLVVLGSLIGFHTGPHTHVVAGAAGVLCAAWIVFMVIDGRGAPVLWALLGADVVVSVGVGVMAWNSLSARHTRPHHLTTLEGAEGIAVGDLNPDGIVRIRGEQWSAVSVNGNVPAHTRVQVLRADGVRLEVWGDEAVPVTHNQMFTLDDSESKEHHP